MSSSHPAATRAAEKFRRGQERLERMQSEYDRVHLGAAMLALHGSLEAYLRLALERAGIPAAMEFRRFSWWQIVEAAQRHLAIDRDNAAFLLAMNTRRNGYAHGDEFSGKLQDVHRYIQFIQTHFAPPEPEKTVREDHVTYSPILIVERYIWEEESIDVLLTDGFTEVREGQGEPFMRYFEVPDIFGF